MANDSRIGKLESDVSHLQSDMTEVKSEVKSLRASVELLRTDFLSFKTEMVKELGLLKTSVQSVYTAIERTKLWMVITGAGTILSVWGAAVALARFLKP